ncbi:Glycosyl transferase family 11 [Rosistilla ulvae]|uniref:Glycosyl transferase family 11 n=1 Tax=Rosistilla ulvae TaxID=1930277 RepID=A0A517LYN8_9BACT|nr:alpha-1,2-fucosyltransferase [Rosistilla ulvae]QDS87746.1 Glycosyl transferase family 11 [Rosistilla ulvae]
MIVTRLIGGLGNQLFQYAYGAYLAKQAGVEHYIDVSAFEEYQLRDMTLDRFAIRALRLPEALRHRVPARYSGASKAYSSWQSFAARAFPRQSGVFRLRREKPFGFRDKWLHSHANLYTEGYWQGEAFFPGMEEALREEFRLVDPVSEATAAMARRMDNTQSVALHVRRGDYVSDPTNQKIFRTLEPGYYRRCLEDLRQHVADPQIFLFSNDIPWCLKNLDVGIPFTPVTHNDGATCHEDLYLISQCRHAVIANSSFSWWGAYLAADSDARRVYYPSPWFHPGTLDGTAIPCRKWIGEHQLEHPTAMRSAA